MDLLVVAAAGDPLAGVVALAAEGRGKKAVVMDHVHAARLFSIGGDGETMTVEPEVPMLLRPPQPLVPNQEADTAFLDGECFATLWAAAALTKASVVNRPTTRGLEAGWSPSGAVTERRAEVPVAAELYVHAGAGLTPPDARTWAIEDARGRTRRWTKLDSDDVPFRARALLDGEAYERVVVLDRRAWRSTTVELEEGLLENRSAAAVAALGLRFAVVTWGVTEDLKSLRMARIDPYPRADQLFPVWGEVGPALLEALGC